MAVTKIWPVKGRLDAVIRYAGNEEKTRLPDLTGLSAGKDDLSDVLQYAARIILDREYLTCVLAPSAVSFIGIYQSGRDKHLCKGCRIEYIGIAERANLTFIAQDNRCQIGTAIERHGGN